MRWVRDWSVWKGAKNVFRIFLSRSRKILFLAAKRLESPVWTYLTIFESFLQQFFHKSCPNILFLFGIILKNIVFKWNCNDYFWSNFVKMWATFLFQHLVTLLMPRTTSDDNNWHFVLLFTVTQKWRKNLLIEKQKSSTYSYNFLKHRIQIAHKVGLHVRQIVIKNVIYL